MYISDVWALMLSASSMLAPVRVQNNDITLSEEFSCTNQPLIAPNSCDPGYCQQKHLEIADTFVQAGLIGGFVKKPDHKSVRLKANRFTGFCKELLP